MYVCLSAGILLAGWEYYGNYKTKYIAKVGEQLTAIGKLKADELTTWRNERLGDAKFFFNNDVFANLVGEYLKNRNDIILKGEISAWLNNVETIYSYDNISLLDSDFKVRISIPEKSCETEDVLTHACEILKTKQILFEDFYWNEINRKAFLRISVPIFEKNSGKFLAVVSLRIDPEIFLYPYVQSWPVPNIKTEETVLARRNGNCVEYLNELRFRKNTAFKIKRLITDVNIVSVRAALGSEGIIEGKDYRGVEVLAYTRAVNNSPWYLITKIGKSEVFDFLHEQLAITIIFITVLLSASGAATGYMWKRQIASFYRQKYDEATELHTTFDSIASPISIIDKNFRIKKVNKKFAELLGKNPYEVVGKNCHNLIHNTNESPENCPVRQTLLHGKSAKVEMCAFYKNFEVSTYPVFDEKGDINEIVHIMRDLTEQKQAEATLNESQNRFRAMFEYSAAGMAVAGRDLHFIDVNNAFCQMLGYSKEQMLKMTVKDVTFPEDLALTNQSIQKLASGEVEMYSMEKRYLHCSGTIVWVLVCVSKIKNAAGDLLNLAQVYDITKRKAAENKLRESQNRLALALDSSQMGVWSLDIVNNKRYFDDQVCRLLGIDPLKFRGEAEEFFEVLHPDDKEKVKSALQKTIEQDLSYETEYRVIWKDGSIHNITARGRLDHDDQGHPTKINGIIWDVTESKKLEKRQEFLSKMLIVINQNKHLVPIIQEVNSLIKEFTGFEAVGIRLKEADDFPYYASKGFPEKFIEKEKFLCARDEKGEIIRNTNDIPLLECMCGNVISGRIDPDLPFFTKGGSFWTNSTSMLLASTTDEDRQTKTRNYCNKVGYESVGLIPLNGGKENIGFLQLNDHRKDLFTLEMIEFIEIAAKYIGSTFVRKKAEEELRRSKERFQVIASSTPDLLMVQNRELRYEYVLNPQMGMTKEYMVGRTDYDILTKEDAEKLTKIKSAVLETGKPAHIETDLITYTGEKEFFRGSYVPKFDSYGQVDGLIGYFQNITNSKKVEEIIRQNEERLRLTAEAAEIGFWEMNFTTGELKWDANLSHLLGLEENLRPSEELFMSCVHEEDRKMLDAKIRGAIEKKEDYIAEYRVLHKNGEIHWLYARGRTFYDVQDKAIRFVGTVIDITQRKKMEQELQDANYHLKIANAVAKDAATMAAMAEECERQKIATMLHDNIGQDLVLSLMKLDVFSKSKPMVQDIKEIEEIKKTIGRTIESVRTLSFDLSSSVLHKFGFAHAIENWITEQAEKDHNIKFNITNNVKEIDLDRDKNVIVYQAIRELLINIIKHSNATQAEFRISRNNGTIEAAIEDNGIGFEPLKAEGIDPKKGGFGLYNIRQRLNYIGGNVIIESGIGSGTKVILKIPVNNLG